MTKDRRQRIIEMVSNDLDIRSQWMGISWTKRTGDKAKEAAKYLAGNIWGKQQKDTSNIENRQKIINEDLTMNEGKITMEELTAIIRKLKRRKAPGPDEIPIEFFKELTEELLESMLKIINEWWEQENIPEETMRAKVVLI